MDTNVFDDLDIDCMCSVLSYLTLTERIKFERVNKTWQDIFNSFWNKQRVLYVVSDQLACQPAGLELSWSRKCHPARGKDLFRLDQIWSVIACDAILSRSANLEALYWSVANDQVLFMMLTSHCKKLRHLSAHVCDKFIFNMLLNLNLKCLYLENETQKDSDMNNIRDYMTKGGMELKNLKLPNLYDVHHLYYSFINLEKLETISLSQDRLGGFLNLLSVENFPNLRAFYSNSASVKKFNYESLCKLDLFPKLEHLAFYQLDEDMAPWFNKLQMTSRLKSLKIACGSYDNVLKVLVEKALQLKELTIRSRGADEDMLCMWQEVAKMKRLRRICFDQFIGMGFFDGLSYGLNHLHKLRLISANFIEKPDTVVFDDIVSYADEHPKRQITMRLSSCDASVTANMYMPSNLNLTFE